MSQASIHHLKAHNDSKTPKDHAFDMENTIAEIRYHSLALHALTEDAASTDRDALAYFAGQLKDRTNVLSLNYVRLLGAFRG